MKVQIRNVLGNAQVFGQSSHPRFSSLWLRCSLGCDVVWSFLSNVAKVRDISLHAAPADDAVKMSELLSSLDAHRLGIWIPKARVSPTRPKTSCVIGVSEIFQHRDSQFFSVLWPSQLYVGCCVALAGGCWCLSVRAAELSYSWLQLSARENLFWLV